MSSKSNRRKKRKTWKKQEVVGLLKCYLARKDEFQNRRKKIYGYANVLEDMISQGFTDSNTTVAAVEKKMSTLFDAYKAVKNNKLKKGSPKILRYKHEMEEIFANEPMANTSGHIIHLGCGTTFPLEEEETETIDSAANSSQHVPIGDINFDKEASTFPTGRKGGIKSRLLAQKKKAAQMNKDLTEMLFEKMQNTVDEHLKVQREIIKQARARKLKLLDDFLKKMEKKKQILELIRMQTKNKNKNLN